MKKIILVFSVFSLLLFSCKEEEEIPPIAIQKIANFDVIVLNEGNFQWGQGTVSMYDSRSREVINKVFQANNDQRPLGDVAQSITFKGDTAFLVVNNSNKIEIIDLKTFKSIGRIDGLNSPRNMLIINKNKAYVSDLYENQIYIVNPEDFSIIGKIPSNGWTEEMVLFDGKAFVCQMDSNQLYVIDTQTDQVVKKIPTATSPQYLEVDKNGTVWVSCTGGLNNDTAAIQKINGNTLTVEKSFYAKNHNAMFMELAINQAADQLCVLSNEGLFQFSIQAEQLSDKPLIKTDGRNLYTMNINPKNNEIYLCDAMDYQQKGVAYRYNWSGKEIDHFRIGIIPGAIYFP